MVERRKISELLFFQEGPGVRNTQYTTDGIKLLNVANLQDGKVDLSTSNRYISEEEAYGRYKHFLVDDGDFIIASSGIKVEYFEKKMGFINKSHLPLCMNTSTIRFKVLDNTRLDIRYFMYYLKSNDFKIQLSHQITGSAQLNFGPSHLKKMDMPLLPLSEQQHIVEVLDAICALIAKRKHQIALLDDVAKSLFVEMFGDLSFNEYNWQTISLFELGDSKEAIKCGPFGTQLNKGEYQTSGVPLWGIPEINSSFRIQTTTFLTEEKSQLLDAYSVIPNDIVMSRKGTVGKCAIYPKTFVKGIIHSDVLRIRPDQNIINSHFLMCQLHYSNYVLNQIDNVSNGAIMKGINVTKLKNIRVHLPPLELQEEFAARVEKIETQKRQLEVGLTKMEEVYGALMQEYFG